MKRSKRQNHARTVKECPDSSTESNSEEDYAYSVKNTGNPKTKTTICINSRKINFIVDTGATVDVIDSKTYDRLQSSVKLSKTTTKIFAYGSDKPLPLKGQFQAALESDKRFTNTAIHVVQGSSRNLLSVRGGWTATRKASWEICMRFADWLHSRVDLSEVNISRI